jgi:hypothetical protein
MNKVENHKYWSKKIAEFRRSGKTKEEWCQKQNISNKQFTYWLRQFSGETTETQWLPVEIKEVERLPLVLKVGTATIEVPSGFDKEHLLAVLEVLKGL